MKTTIYCIIILTIIVGCSKSSSTTSVAMSAKINDTPWLANQIWTTSEITAPVETTIVGKDTLTGRTIILLLYNYNNTIGNFKIDGIKAMAGLKGTAAASGQITVYTISDGYIMGTFNFITVDSNNISAGTFTAKLP